MSVDTMKDLIKKLNDAADAYYNGKDELMTDFEWDALFDKLKKLEEESGIILPDSPTHKVSADSIAGNKEEHEHPALSLAKTKLPIDLVKWAQGRAIWISWKLDGLTLVVTYDNGKLSKIVTRGDGAIGTNISHLASGINGIPATIPEKGHLVLRGEAVISYKDFENYIEFSQEDYANPRNLASGSLSLKDPEELKPRKLQWLPFSLVHSDKNFSSWGEQMDFIASLGFNPVEREKVDLPTLENVEKCIEGWTKKVTNSENPFPVDGLVVTYDDVEFSKTGSVTGHHATRGGLAFKWQDTQAITRLNHIEWSCAVSSISPIAVFDAVQLEGTSVQRASLCNISECERLGIGGKGTEIAVIKANKIIPKVVSVVNKVGDFEIPQNCPICNAPTKIEIAESGTKKLSCTNEWCIAKELRKLEKFVSIDGLDIRGLSEQTLSRLIKNNLIKTIVDIYHLHENFDKIASWDGFGLKSANNLMKAIENSRNAKPEKFLVALSIPLCGVDMAKRLMETYGDIKTLVETTIQASEELFGNDIFANIDGIGPMRSQAFVEWFREQHNRELVSLLMKELTFEPYRSTASKTGTCQGLTFVITGDVHHYANRNELKTFIESQGGKTSGAVSKSTNYLINNDIASTSGKNKKAKELNIPIISEDEFIEKFSL
ncbi:MAG: NAD-dependent DNA ligase LigA [Kiritimatiellae bacterium]|nr:NAD-dependent DNA ligase LigA [Kiritimatiellia bacterium]